MNNQNGNSSEKEIIQFLIQELTNNREVYIAASHSLSNEEEALDSSDSDVIKQEVVN